jgi:sodium transport system permease protein
MRPRIVWTIFRKELTEALRDRLTIIVVVLLPMLVYPLMIMAMGKLQKNQAVTQEERVSQIAIWGEAPAPLLDWIGTTNSMKVEVWKHAPAAIKAGLESGRFQPPGSQEEDLATNEVFNAARSAVTGRKLDAVLVVWPGFTDALANESLGRMSICYDSVVLSSGKARERLERTLGEFRRNIVRERERHHGLARGFASGLDVRAHNIAPPKRQSGEVFGQALPFVLIMLSAIGALYASVDLTAGEKDRATMQTLLCAPVHNVEIVGGKFLAVWCISLIAALANTVSLGATIARAARGTELLHLPPTTFALALVLLLPATFTITAFFLATAMLARDAKDAGNFLGASLTVLMMPMIVSLMPGVDLNRWTSFAPLVNISLLIKSVFLGEAKPDTIFLTVVSSLLYAALSITLAARAFGREQILLGGRGSFLALLRPDRKPGERPTASIALLTFAVVQVLAFYGSLMLEKRGMITNILVTELAFFLTPVLVLAMVKKFPLRETFSLRTPPWRGIVAAVLIGISGWAAVGGLVIRLLPPPDSVVKALEKIVLLDNTQTPLWLAWVLVALVPAVSEELLFRGLILSGLRPLGNRTALIVSSLLFAVAHASIYRLLPTLFLGLLLGWIVLRTGSLFCSILIHVLNNGIAVTIARSPSLAKWIDLDDATYVPWWLTGIACVILAAGIFLLWRPFRSEDPGQTKFE